MTISDSIPSSWPLRMPRSPIRQVAPAALAIIAVVSISGAGSANAIFALTTAVIMIGGAYWLGRASHDRETSCAGSTDDGLTGLPNRSGFFSALQDRLACDGSRPLAVGLISLDSFSAINAAHGHRIGDRVLRDLAVRLKQIPEAFVAYLGGDKFGFLVRAEPLQARILTEAVRELATAPYKIADLRLRVGCSGGLAVLRDGSETADSLFDQASCALRSAKVSNLGGVTLYDADLERRVRESRAIEAALQASQRCRFAARSHR